MPPLLHEAQLAIFMHVFRDCSRNSRPLSISLAGPRDPHAEPEHFALVGSKRGVFKDRVDLQREPLLAATAKPQYLKLDEIHPCGVAERINCVFDAPARRSQMSLGREAAFTLPTGCGHHADTFRQEFPPT